MSSVWKSRPLALNCSLKMYYQQWHRCKPFGKKHHCGWESHWSSVVPCARCISRESHSLGLECKLGGKFHLKLNIGSRPIANKYHEGKLKRTLKRELKVPEIAEGEANGTSVVWWDCCVFLWSFVSIAQAWLWGVSSRHTVRLILCVIFDVHVSILLRKW